MKNNKTDETLHITIKIANTLYGGTNTITLRRAHHKAITLHTTNRDRLVMLACANPSIHLMSYNGIAPTIYTGNVTVPSNMIAVCPINGLFPNQPKLISQHIKA